MASRVVLTGQVKRARGGATWMLQEDKAEAGPANANACHSHNENASPNLQPGAGEWETSFRKLQIGAPEREEEARLRRIGEQYRLPAKELLGAGSLGEDSLGAILSRQKQLLSELRTRPLREVDGDAGGRSPALLARKAGDQNVASSARGKAASGRENPRPWASSYKPAAAPAGKEGGSSRTVKAGARKAKPVPALDQQHSDGELKKDVKLEAGRPGDGHALQEKHVMVFASQAEEWEAEMNSMASEPPSQVSLWKDSSTSLSVSVSTSSQGQKGGTTGSEGENGIGRYTMGNLTDLHKEILSLAGDGAPSGVRSGDRIPSRKDILTRTGRKSRRLSQLLRSEEDLLRQNKHYAVELQLLQDQLDTKDNEIQSVRTAGMLLKSLYYKQCEELKALKASYPATFKETTELRELCRKQEHEMNLSRAELSAFKSQVSSLTAELVSEKRNLAKVKVEKDLLQQKVERGERALQTRCFHCNTEPNAECLQETGRTTVRKTYRKGINSSAVPTLVPYSEEHSQGVRKIGEKLMSDRELGDMLVKLHSYANREQASLQERCVHAFQQLRQSSHSEGSDDLDSVKSRLGRILGPVGRSN